MPEIPVLVIGASVSGLAVAGSLSRSGVPYSIIERHGQVAYPWHQHYERLHLHTNKRVSSLPYKRFSKLAPRYPSRQDVINYLEAYCSELEIKPQFETAALAVKRSGDTWITQTTRGEIASRFLVMATGAFCKPRQFTVPGIESFNGECLHSADFRSGKIFNNKTVLVIGFGNSACEIAIDLYEQGAIPSMSVRSSVNVVPRDILGVPILEISQVMGRLPPRLADKINAPLLAALIGDITKWGLKKKPYGPFEQIKRDGTVPVLDIGTMKHIRSGHITVFGEIDHIEGNRVFFKDGTEHSFDVIVAATGYERNIQDLIQLDEERVFDLSRPIQERKTFGKEGLYFCGYYISPIGQINEIAREAKRIAEHIAERFEDLPQAGRFDDLKISD